MDTIATAGLTGITYAAPANAVRIAPGASIQSAVNANPAGTQFLLSEGTYSGQTISPKNGNGFYGENGNAVLDGNGLAHAFRGQAVSDVTISGLKITDYAPPNHGIGALGTDASAVRWVLQGNEFTGIKSSVPIMLGTDMIVRENHIHHNEMAGIGGWGISGAVVEHNEISFNNESAVTPFSGTGAGAGIKVAQAINIRIAENYIHSNIAAPGVWADYNSDEILIEGNRIEKNAAGGIFIELNYGATIRDNYIADNNMPFYSKFEGGGIYIYNAQDQEIVDNTLSGNGGGVWIYESDRGSGNQGAFITQDVNVSGNTIIMDQGNNGATGGALNDPTIRFSNNDYWISGAGSLFLGLDVSQAAWQSKGLDTAASGSIFNIGALPPSSQQPPPASPVNEAVVVKSVSGSDALSGTPGAQSWGALSISATNWTGASTLATKTSDGIGVQGGRFEGQLDYNPDTGASEVLALSFSTPIDSATLRITRMNAAENGPDAEMGAWKAYDASGALVSQGLLDPRGKAAVAQWTYDFQLDPAGDFSRLELTALPYNNGAAGGSGESSDYALAGVSYLPSDTLL